MNDTLDMFDKKSVIISFIIALIGATSLTYLSAEKHNLPFRFSFLGGMFFAYLTFTFMASMIISVVVGQYRENHPHQHSH